MFGKVEVKKKEALQRIDFWDEVKSQRPLTQGEREERVAARSDYLRWALMEEIA